MSPAGAPGHGDGADPGLQPERTTLAWARTGVAATTASIVTARVAIARGSLVLAAAAGVVALVALAGLLTTARGHAQRRQQFEGERLRRELPATARMTVLATVALCVIGLALVAGG